MTIFRNRLMRPNVLAVLRELEGRVNVGKVLYSHAGLAVISGLNNDAPLGTKLAFVSGAVGAVLWNSSDQLVYALILGGAADVSVGEAVECKIRGVLQVVDESKGPVTRKDYELVMAPAEETAAAPWGKVLDHMGRPLHSVADCLTAVGTSTTSVSISMTPDDTSEGSSGSSSSTASRRRGRGDAPFSLGAECPSAAPRCRPMVNAPILRNKRSPIVEGLLTGIKAVDILTPVARGSTMLIVGPSSSGKTALALDAVLAQRSTGVKCVYATVNDQRPQAAHLHHEALRQAGVEDHCCVVTAPPDALLGERYAAICTACAIGERVRDEGGHALVVVDDLQAVLDVWGQLQTGQALVGPQTQAAGVSASHAMEQDDGAADDKELVEVDGMLLPISVAQRRRFFSQLFHRAAKLPREAGSGSLTMLLLVQGRLAKGVACGADLDRHHTLMARQREQMEASVRLRAAESEAFSASQAVQQDMPVQAVEEFMSMADGQVVLEPRPALDSPYVLDPQLSLSRKGSRAYSKALGSLAAQVRLELVQAADARRYSLGPSADPLTLRCDMRARRLAAALVQEAGQPVVLEDQVIMLLAIRDGYLDAVPLHRTTAVLRAALCYVRDSVPAAVQEVAQTRFLSALAGRQMHDALAMFVRLWPLGGEA